jgi:hypothetical protein
LILIGLPKPREKLLRIYCKRPFLFPWRGTMLKRPQQSMEMANRRIRRGGRRDIFILCCYAKGKTKQRCRVGIARQGGGPGGPPYQPSHILYQVETAGEMLHQPKIFLNKSRYCRAGALAC